MVGETRQAQGGRIGRKKRGSPSRMLTALLSVRGQLSRAKKMRRLLSLRETAATIGVARSQASRLAKRGVLLPDFTTQHESLFDPERLPELQAAAQSINPKPRNSET